MKLEQFLDYDRCDVPVRVTKTDGTVEYAWECGVSWGETLVLTGTEHTTGARLDWRCPEDEISNLEVLSTEEYRKVTGWTGFL